jgi:hypothetical protein
MAPMLAPTRPLPRVGAAARIGHFGGGWERGTVTEVREGGRLLAVRSDSGELLEFALSPATAKFVAGGSSHGVRLELL